MSDSRIDHLQEVIIATNDDGDVELDVPEYDTANCDAFDDDDDGQSKDSSRTMDTGIHSRSEEIIYHSDSHTNNIDDVDCQKRCDISSLLTNKEADFKIEEKIEEITTTKWDSDGETEENVKAPYGCDQYEYELNFNCGGKAAFPELGMEIVDMHEQFMAADENEEGEEDDQTDNVDHHRCVTYASDNVKRELMPSIGVKLIDCVCWEENWLFQKKKKADSDYVPQYCLMNLDLALSPVCMTIPNPSQMISPSVGSKPIDELSDLSEHNSAESIEFSSSDEDTAESETMKDLQQNNKSATKLNSSPSARQGGCNESRRRSKQITSKSIPLTLNVPQFVPKHLRKQDDMKLCLNSDKKSDKFFSLPEFTMIPQSASVQSGILVQFCCRVKGEKPLGVSWYCNGKLIENDANYRVFKHFTDHILEIQNTNRELSGQYTCCVYNNSGVQWTDFNVNINDRNNVGAVKDPFKVIQFSATIVSIKRRLVSGEFVRLSPLFISLDFPSISLQT